jgi:hypothetical protein
MVLALNWDIFTYRLNKNMKKTFIALTISAIVITTGIFYVMTMDARGLKNYLNDFLAPQNIELNAMSCDMIGRTRLGFCKFRASNEEFAHIKTVLHLTSSQQQPSISFTEGCIKLGWNYLEDNSITIYQASPPLPPMQGNDRSSFIRLLYNPASGEGCIDMEYPYS